MNATHAPASKTSTRAAATALLAASLLAGGCASAPETTPALGSAQAAYESARASADVLRYAPDQLAQAEETLARAAAAQTVEDMNSLAYVAERQTETALKQSETKVAEARIEELSRVKNRVQLEAREAELAAARQELDALQAKRTARGLVITLGSVLFQTGQANLLPGAMDSVERLATYLRENPDATVLIEGHTDSTGSPMTNMQLSQARADSVAASLRSLGVGSNRTRTAGLGPSQPVASNDTAAGRQQNRRVEIIIQ